MVDEFSRTAGGGGTSEPVDGGGSTEPTTEPVDDVQRVDPGAPSGGSDPTRDSGGVVDRVTSTVGETVSGAGTVADNVGSTVTDTIDGVQSGVSRVEETLPGPTGTAFATGVGVAAVPEPTPVTETTGAAIAGGAALVGGGVLASRAIRNRGSELEIGERVRSELGVGQQNQDVTEVGVGERVTSEVGVGETGPTETEVGLGSTTGVSELDVVGTGSAGGLNAAQQIGVGGTTGEVTEEDPEQDDVEIADPIDDTNDIARQAFEQQQYEVQEIYGDEQFESVPERERVESPGPFNDAGGAGIAGSGEPETFGEREETFAERFNRFIEDDQPQQVNRDPVRFPADEAASGTAAGVLEQEAPDFNPGERFGLGTATGAGAAGDLLIGGVDTNGTGEQSIDPGVQYDPLGSGAVDDASGVGSGTEPSPGSNVDDAVDTDGGTDTGPADQAAPAQTAITTATPAAQAPIQGVGSPGSQSFSTPELSTFESQPAEPTTTVPGPGGGQGRRRRPPRPGPDDGPDDDPQPFAFAQDSDEFGSGILSGSEAVDRLFGR